MKKSTDHPKYIDLLFSKPKRDVGLNAPIYEFPAKNTVQQADVLYLPNDDGYKYLLVVVDNGSRKTDAEPLKSKEPKEVLKAFLKIFKRSILKQPKEIEVDPGTEFKSDVAKYFKDHDVVVRIGKTGRHRQQALVERRNQVLGTYLFKKMTEREYITGQTNREWIADLPDALKFANKNADKIKKRTRDFDYPVAEGDSLNMLEVGAKVRVALDEPRDVLTTGQKLHGKFRSHDIKWNPTIRTIESIKLKPNQPPLYILNDYDGVSYTKNQLQLVPKDEVLPQGDVIRKQDKNTTYYVEKIVEKKIIDKKVNYLIKWKGFSSKDNTYEPLSELKKFPGVIDMIDKFNQKKT